MYSSHRGMAQPNNRLDEYIQGIRQEFENATSQAGEHDQRRKFGHTRLLHNRNTWRIHYTCGAAREEMSLQAIPNFGKQEAGICVTRISLSVLPSYEHL